MEPSYFVHAVHKISGRKLKLPVYAVPELDEQGKTAKQSADNIAVHLKGFGWQRVKVEAA